MREFAQQAMLTLCSIGVGCIVTALIIAVVINLPR